MGSPGPLPPTPGGGFPRPADIIHSITILEHMCGFPTGPKEQVFKRFCRSLNHFCYKNKLDSFRSYQLVEADLLVCMPAPGDRIKVGFDEMDKTLCAYIVF